MSLFVLLCIMADKLVSTCETNTTLFSVEINDPNLSLSCAYLFQLFLMPATANALKRATLCPVFSSIWLTSNCVAVTWYGISFYHRLLTPEHKKRRQEFQLKFCKFCELRNLTFFCKQTCILNEKQTNKLQTLPPNLACFSHM